MSLQAWHLPDFEVERTTSLLHAAGKALLVPAHEPHEIGAISRRLERAGDALRQLDGEEIIGAVDAVARRFRASGDPLRETALEWLPRVTGYAPAMCALVLERMAQDWCAPALRELLRAELPDPSVLDRFAWHARGQRVRATGPRLALQVMAGNVPGVAVSAIIRALLVRGPTLCKTAAGEPVLPALFGRALYEQNPVLGRAVAVTYWRGGDRALEDHALDSADVVVHYGSGEALADLRRRLPPHARLVEHGPRISFAVVAREFAGRRRIAAEAARAVALFDQQGCVSPHVIYVEAGGRVDARAFGARVASGLEELARELPRGRLEPQEAALIQQLRGGVEFRVIAGEPLRLWTGSELAWTVIFDPDPVFTATCLNRTVWVKPVPDLEYVPHLVRAHAPLLQSVAVEAPRARRERLAELLALAGAARITSLAAMPWPRPSWHHDGRGPLRELLRFTDLEARS